MEPKIVGIMFEHSDKTVSYWDGFSLTYDDQETIGVVLCQDLVQVKMRFSPF